MAIKIVKGINYTQKITVHKDGTETCQHWHRFKPRAHEECGIWDNGKQIATFETMHGMGVSESVFLFQSSKDQEPTK